MEFEKFVSEKEGYKIPIYCMDFNQFVSEKQVGLLSKEDKIKLKIECFEYLFVQYVRWFIEEHIKTKNELPTISEIENNFSKLKLMKLLFFTCAVEANKNDNGLLHIFDEWYAMPFGHVENDVYNNFDMVKILKFTYNGIEICEDLKKYLIELKLVKDVRDL
jgi:hypothetical protein